MKHLSDIFISACSLMVITGVVTAALAGTDVLTSKRIAARAEESANAARREVIAADTFEEQRLSGDETVYYTAYQNGTAVGYVFTAEAVGKSAGLTVMTGISSTGVITGVKVLDDNETAGYVDKVVKAGFTEAFVGQEAIPFQLNNDVDAVSQATKTSTGICAAVNKAVTQYYAVREGNTK